MRSIVIDELLRPDMERLTAHLAATCVPSGMTEVFWLELPPDVLTPEQAAHPQCGAHRVALVLEEDSLRLELLVRSKHSLRCECTAYATKGQRNYLLGYLDRLIEELGLST